MLSNWLISIWIWIWKPNWRRVLFSHVAPIWWSVWHPFFNFCTVLQAALTIIKITWHIYAWKVCDHLHKASNQHKSTLFWWQMSLVSTLMSPTPRFFSHSQPLPTVVLCKTMICSLLRRKTGTWCAFQLAKGWWPSTVRDCIRQSSAGTVKGQFSS